MVKEQLSSPQEGVKVSSSEISFFGNAKICVPYCTKKEGKYDLSTMTAKQ